VPPASIAPNALLAMNTLLTSAGADMKLSKKSAKLLLGTGKPKKERKLRDPNAPKRPLTAFFLYSSSARPIVKRDLGDKVSASEVSQEVLKRWNEMPEEEKHVRLQPPFISSYTIPLTPPFL
jgi:transcriptional regulator HMO1